MELGSNEAIKQAVVGGLGISVLSSHTLSLALDVPMDRLTLLDVEGFPIERHWYVAYPKGKQPSVVANTFLDYLKQAHHHLSDVLPYKVETTTLGHHASSNREPTKDKDYGSA